MSRVRTGMSVAAVLQDAKELETFLEKRMELLRRDLMDRRAIVKTGKYAGRQGLVKGVMLDEDMRGPAVLIQVQPFSLREPGVLLWDHPDARSFWRLDCVEIYDE